MGCDRFVEAISAIIDGEEPGIDERLIDAHVARCANCRAFRDSMQGVRRRMVVREVTTTPDASRKVAKLAAVADRAAAWQLPRILLAVVAIEVVVLSVGDLVMGGDDSASVHSARHLAAFSLAYAVLLMLVVMRPARARTALPVAGVLALALAITAVADLVAGRVPLAGETLHIPEIISVLLIWLLAVPTRRLPLRLGRTEAPPRQRPVLTKVDRDAV
jgi:predicted anti-sigma-YlaC factor YlaD